MVLCAFYVQAQYTPGEKSGYYLRGNFNNSFDDNIGGQPQHEFLWGDATGSWIYLPLDEPLRVTGNCEFAIGPRTWADGDRRIIVASYSGEQFNIGDNKCYFGGGKNALFPYDTPIGYIKVVLPRNEDENNPDPSEAGVLTLNGVPGTMSNYALQAWIMPQSGEAGVAWDTSGGLYAPIGVVKRNDEYDSRYGYLGPYTQQMTDFYHKYVSAGSSTNVDWIYFLTVAPDKLRKANATVDADGNIIDARPVADYSAAKGEIVRYYDNSNVYCIDFTEFDPRGLYIYVPTVSSIGDVEGQDVYNGVEPILRSGVRFGLFNFHYPDEDNQRRYRYVKYGRCTRLNALPTDIGPACGYPYWNGEKVTGDYDPSNTGDEWHQKVGDNRLLSEYRMWITRIILEVVNEGGRDNEHIYIRFEGRYDLESAMSSKMCNSFVSDISGANNVGLAPNIFRGNSFEWYDRGFARFYANNDPSLHGRTLLGGARYTPDEIKELCGQYMLPDFTSPYNVEASYGVIGEDGHPVVYIDCDNDGHNLRRVSARNTVEYTYVRDDTDVTQSYFAITGINGVASDPTAEENRIPTFTHDESYSSDPKYGNATRTILQTRRRTALYDPAMTGNRPDSIYTVITYHFPDAEPNNVPSYRHAVNVEPEFEIDATPVLNARKVARGINIAAGAYCSDLSIEGSRYASYGDDDDINASIPYPVTRWEFRQWDDTDGSWVKDDDSHPKSTFNAPYATTHVGNGHRGELISEYNDRQQLGDTELKNVWLTGATKLEESETGVTVGYRADVVYTLGYVMGMPITEKALSLYKALAAESPAADAGSETSDGNPYSFPGHKATRDNPGILVPKDGDPSQGLSLKFYLSPERRVAHTSVSFLQSDSLDDVKTTGIDSTERVSMSIGVDGCTLSVVGATGPVTVYSVSGAVVYNGCDNVIELPSAGAYIVRSATDTAKVIAR